MFFGLVFFGDVLKKAFSGIFVLAKKPVFKRIFCKIFHREMSFSKEPYRKKERKKFGFPLFEIQLFFSSSPVVSALVSDTAFSVIRVFCFCACMIFCRF